uniref:ATP synthase complex subunit 8 n=1 Tax=Albula glossodonta TaxID=121402 RepID=Q6ZLZ4_9TELE|nr:ATPase subunits 8 [Albula glossodonta]
MPQLNPAPWFFIFVLSWFIYLTVIHTKVTGHVFANEPTVSVDKLESKPEPWNWPWH